MSKISEADDAADALAAIERLDAETTAALEAQHAALVALMQKTAAPIEEFSRQYEARRKEAEAFRHQVEQEYRRPVEAVRVALAEMGEDFARHAAAIRAELAAAKQAAPLVGLRPKASLRPKARKKMGELDKARLSRLAAVIAACGAGADEPEPSDELRTQFEPRRPDESRTAYRLRMGKTGKQEKA